MAISSILLISKYGNFAVKINHPGDLGSGRGSDFERERVGEGVSGRGSEGVKLRL